MMGAYFHSYFYNILQNPSSECSDVSLRINITRINQDFYPPRKENLLWDFVKFQGSQIKSRISCFITTLLKSVLNRGMQ